MTHLVSTHGDQGDHHARRRQAPRLLAEEQG